MMRSIGVAIIGCGAIGSYIAEALDKDLVEGFEVKILYDRIPEKAYRLSSSLTTKPRVALRFEEIIEAEDVDLVVEAASQKAVRDYALRVIDSGKNLMIMSVGALRDLRFYEKLRDAAKRKGVKLYIPSGAIAGLDAIKAARVASIRSVTLISRKPPHVFQDNAYVKSRGIKLSELKEPVIVYEGSALEACKLFPSSINVAATLSLASLGPEKVKVRIIADPQVSGNIHEVVVEGEFGRIECRTINKPSPKNPKTSLLAALSALATLREITESIQIGT